MSEEFTILEEGVTDAAPPAAEAGTETVAAGAEASATPEAVPYERFQKQNHDFRALQENHTQLQGKFEQVGQWVRDIQPYLTQLQAQQQQTAQPEPQAAPQQDDWLANDPAMKAVREQESLIKAQEERLKAHETRWQQFQVSQEQTRIQNQIESARAEFPHLSDAEVLDGLMVNPNANIRTLAKRSSDRFIQRAQEYTRSIAQAPAPKRLVQGGVPAMEQREVRNLRDAREATMAFLSRQE